MKPLPSRTCAPSLLAQPACPFRSVPGLRASLLVRTLVFALAPIAPFVSLLPPPLSAAPVAAQLESLTGAHTRIVWTQSPLGSRDYVGASGGFTLWGLDSGAGQSARQILATPRSYSRPLITPDGQQVVYSDRTTKITRIVSWDGSLDRDFAYGFAASVWRDPATAIQWVYLRSGDGTSNDPIERRRLDQPGVVEPVYSATPNGHPAMPWFRLSADGTRAADAFPWPRCGFVDVPAGTSTVISKGCWPSMCPDNSYRFFVFHGNHRVVSMFDSGGTNKRDIPLNTAPGVDGDDIYFPHWSNHPRFFTMTGPGVGGDRANLYLGQFDPAFTKVERWVQITNDQRGDFFGDAWIAPTPPS
ncbi:hypothetical protein BH23VER1_BH23VER1_03940 [soil metagenome]